ncbi:MAG: hypothetical protein WC824_06010 [Bacteroidota bacterium]|jgi:hypothetical protein
MNDGHAYFVPTVSDSKAIELLVKWFAGISDGNWGATNLQKMVSSMGEVNPLQKQLYIDSFNKLFLNPNVRSFLKTKYKIDVSHGEVDGKVASVHIRRILDPIPVVKVKSSRSKKARKRDDRLPEVGTMITTKVIWKDEIRDVAVCEQEDGTFLFQVERFPSESADSLSEAARKAMKSIAGIETPGLNGYMFFRLGDWKGLKEPVSFQRYEKRDPVDSLPDLEEKAENQIDEGETVTSNKLPLCSCGKGIDEDLDGNCPACALDEEDDPFGPITLKETPDFIAPEPPKITIEKIKQTFTDAGDYIAHRARPSMLWGASLIHWGDLWVAHARGIATSGHTPEEAMLNWDTLYKTGELPHD